jgi:hypothetical protein
VLQRRLTGVLLATLVALSACGDDTLEDNLVRPGITAMDEARTEACGLNASMLRTAIDAYTMLEGAPPPDEAALVPDFLREETTDWDVVDGQLVPENPACGDAPEVTPIDDIVTSTLPSPTADEVLASFSAEQVEQIGGQACAAELAAIFAAGEQYVAEQSADPEGLQDLVDAGYLTELPGLWQADGDELTPSDGSECTDLTALDLEARCTAEARTMEVAYEASLAMNGDGSDPTEAGFVTDGLLRAELPLVDLGEGGAAIAAPDSGCDEFIDP